MAVEKSTPRGKLASGGDEPCSWLNGTTPAPAVPAPAPAPAPAPTPPLASGACAIVPNGSIRTSALVFVVPGTGDPARAPRTRTGESCIRSHLASVTVTKPSVVLASSTSSDHFGFTESARAEPTTNSPWRARVRATFMRRTSARNPMPRDPAARTVETIMTSFSLPWKASTVLISTSSFQPWPRFDCDDDWMASG